MNRYGAALSIEEDLDRAIADCAERARTALGGKTPDIALIFVSHHHRTEFATLAKKVKEATGAVRLLGCGAETVVGEGREIEAGPALSLWLAHLPGASLTEFRLTAELDKDSMLVHGMPQIGLGSPEEVDDRQASLLLIGEPFSFPVDPWLQMINERHPGLPVFGGMASGGAGPGRNGLFFRDAMLREGAVGILIEGVRVHHIVSQGCRPVGRSMVVTRAHDNVIEELAGKPPLAQLQEVFEKSSDEEKELIQSAAQTGSLHIGQVIDEHLSAPGRGDFLVRNVLGVDPSSDAMVIGDYVRRGSTVRFHVRDASSADEDLRALLASAAGEWRSMGALLFSCNGRGTRLFAGPDHDVGCIRRQVGDVPLAGFFAQGEIGPVGGKNFLHGFTASVALFEKT